MASGGYSLVVVLMVLAVVASLVDHRLWGAQAQYLPLMGLVVSKHVGSSQARDRTCIPCITKQILYH